MIADGLTVAFALLAVLWTLLPLLNGDAWWIRGFEFPRVQITLLSVLALSVYGLVIGWSQPLDVAFLGALTLCIIFQLMRILPYTKFYPTQLKHAHRNSVAARFSVLVVNVLTPNRNAAELLKIIRTADPDVVLAIETDAWWQSHLDELESDYTHTVKHPRDNLYGMHLYSKLELINSKVLFLVQEEVPSIHTEVLLRSGQAIALYCLHPAPPSPTENETSAERDAELLMVAKSIDSEAQPVVVMGDLNDVAWSATTRLFQRVSKLLDPRIGRGMFNTFNAKYPIMRWPLDHVFCSRHFRLRSIRRLPFFGSDHFPMHAVLAFEPDGAGSQERLQASPEDVTEANEKIRKVPANGASFSERMAR